MSIHADLIARLQAWASTPVGGIPPAGAYQNGWGPALSDLLTEAAAALQHHEDGFHRDLERIDRSRVAMAQVCAENAVLRGGLLSVNEWHLPYRGFAIYEGSNGERDHFREIARLALAFKAGDR